MPYNVLWGSPVKQKSLACISSPLLAMRVLPRQLLIIGTHAPVIRWDNPARTTPARIFNVHGETSKLLLSGPLHVGGDFIDKLMSRQEVFMNRNLLLAAGMLHWNYEKSEPRLGVRPTEHEPGTLRRFVDVVQQLDLTFDLFSMSPVEVIGMLPPEFDAFRSY